MDWKNEEGYRKLFNTYYNVLCNYAHKILRNDMDAEDVVIEVFVHFWTNKDSIKVEEGKLKSYLFSSVKNKAFGMIRSGKIREKHNQHYSDVISANADDSSLDEDDLGCSQRLELDASRANRRYLRSLERPKQ